MSALPSTPYPAAPSIHPSFSRRVITHKRDSDPETLWVKFNPDADSGLQNFTPALVAEFQDVFDSLHKAAGPALSPRQAIPKYTVIQSSHPEYFSVGGDLRFFKACIDTGDANRLREYSMRCLNLMYSWTSRLKGHNTSIALVQGRALGGGFEMVLSADYIIAEVGSSFGFPEIMFGLFPCTGAMGLLSSRIGAHHAERMMTNKRIYTAVELHEMGLIDELCEDGQGEFAVERFIAQHKKRQKAMLKVQESRYRHAPLNYDEGVRIVEDWVETAMTLSNEEIRSMEMLIMLQKTDPATKISQAA